jgi:hypothetical protein
MLEQRADAIKGLQLTFNTKNINRYTTEILKYEELIEEMIS